MLVSWTLDFPKGPRRKPRQPWSVTSRLSARARSKSRYVANFLWQQYPPSSERASENTRNFHGGKIKRQRRASDTYRHKNFWLKIQHRKINLAIPGLKVHDVYPFLCYYVMGKEMVPHNMQHVWLFCAKFQIFGILYSLSLNLADLGCTILCNPRARAQSRVLNPLLHRNPRVRVCMEIDFW